jgi:predicted nucleotide-binding protein
LAFAKILPECVDVVQQPPAESMLSRFQGDRGRSRLIEFLSTQVPILGNDHDIATQVADLSSLRELSPGDILIRQDATDTDLFLVVSGCFKVFVNGREIGARPAGQHLGEMAIIDPASRRTATVIATAPSVVVRLDGDDFLKIANEHPSVWRAMALALCQRLDARKKFHRSPNESPILFIGSSKESLGVADALAATLRAETASSNLQTTVQVWSKGVFGASSFPVDDLEAQLGISDFAVLVGAGEDQVISRGVQADAPRDNVIFELGLFMGALSRGRTFLLVPRGAKVKIPTDLLGLTPLLYDSGEADISQAVKPAAHELLDIVSKKGSK